MQEPIKTTKAIPFFEVYVCLISAYISAVLFMSDIFAKDSEVYASMARLMPQMAWGGIAFAIALTMALGLLLNCRWIRVFGLVTATFLYVFLSPNIFLDFPTMSSGFYLITPIMSLLSIFYVRFSEL
ncbi:hypothetical protein AB1K91_18050 [Terribacillus sp. 179-K 1B1 HS]|uniref:hypothetical protein n=1 Tax=Terribacillus sp. 179-K 1B1 HS TaxID=3142388 RepID=UPI0039A278EC